MSADLNIMEDMMMINNETRRKLEEMNLSEFIQALDLQEKEPTYQALSFEERLQLTDSLIEIRFYPFLPVSL